jgi:predicted ester cyclase
MFEAFPDVRLEHTDRLVSESTAMAEGIIRGTHTGTYPAPSGARVPGSGRALAVPFMMSMAVEVGAIVKQQIHLDQAEITRQLRPS